MSKDIYASLSGADASLRQLDVLSNNIANLSTTGFKAGRVSFELFRKDEEAYALPADAAPDPTDGALHTTGRPTDLALRGEGFFTVTDGARIMLTRDGQFSVDAGGRLITANGLSVLGHDGPIEVPPGEALRIAENGVVSGDETGPVGRLLLQTGPVAAMGTNLWRPVGHVVEAQPAVVQGAVEGSNVNAMEAMVELIEAGRYFEALNKAMQASDELDARLNQSGGA